MAEPVPILHLPLTPEQATALRQLAEVGIRHSDSAERGAIDMLAAGVALQRLRALTLDTRSRSG
jgi:hypothetical protein